MADEMRPGDIVSCTVEAVDDEGRVVRVDEPDYPGFCRVILRRRAVEPPASVRSDTDIFCALAERLGHSADTKLVILSCDDLGSCHAANEGVYDSLRHGIATSAYQPAPSRRVATDHTPSQSVLISCPSSVTSASVRAPLGLISKE